MQSKRWMAVTGLLSATAIVLSACGTAAGSGGSESAQAGNNVIRIEYVHRLPDGPGMIPVADMVEKWNAAHPNIQVTATRFTGKSSELMTRLKADVANKSAPCLAQVGYGEAPEMFVGNLLEDVSGEASKYKNNYNDSAYSQMSVGGKMVGLPQDTGPLVYLYNEAEFNALGIEVPKTFDELLEAAKKAAAQGKYILDFEPDEAGYWLSAQAAAAGAVWYSTVDNKWKINTTDEKTQAVAKFWQDVLDAQAALTNKRADGSYKQALTSGSLIGNIAPAWEIGYALDKVDGTPYEGQWRVAKLPTIGGSRMTGPDGGSGVAVMKGCQHKTEAMEFNDWLNTQVTDLTSQGLLPAAKGTVATPEKTLRQFGNQDVYQVLTEANGELAPEWGYIPGFSSVAQKMQEKADEVVAGGAKVADIFTITESTSKETLKEAGLPVAEG